MKIHTLTSLNSKWRYAIGHIAGRLKHRAVIEPGSEQVATEYRLLALKLITISLIRFTGRQPTLLRQNSSHQVVVKLSGDVRTVRMGSDLQMLDSVPTRIRTSTAGSFWTHKACANSWILQFGFGRDHSDLYIGPSTDGQASSFEAPATPWCDPAPVPAR